MKIGMNVRITSKAPHERELERRANMREVSAQKAARAGKEDAEARHEAHLQHLIKTGQHEGKHDKPCHERAWQLVQTKGNAGWIAEIVDGVVTDRVMIISLAEIEEAK